MSIFIDTATGAVSDTSGYKSGKLICVYNDARIARLCKIASACGCVLRMQFSTVHFFLLIISVRLNSVYWNSLNNLKLNENTLLN